MQRFVSVLISVQIWIQIRTKYLLSIRIRIPDRDLRFPITEVGKNYRKNLNFMPQIAQHTFIKGSQA